MIQISEAKIREHRFCKVSIGTIITLKNVNRRFFDEKTKTPCSNTKVWLSVQKISKCNICIGWSQITLDEVKAVKSIKPTTHIQDTPQIIYVPIERRFKGDGKTC